MRPQPLIIALTGKPDVGKDTIAQILAPAHGFRAIAFADKLREEMADTIGKLHGDRFSQALLTEAATLADAKRHLSALEKDAPEFSSARP